MHPTTVLAQFGPFWVASLGVLGAVGERGICKEKTIIGSFEAIFWDVV